MSYPIEIRSDQKDGVYRNPLSKYFFLRNFIIGSGFSGGGTGYLLVP